MTHAPSAAAVHALLLHHPQAQVYHPAGHVQAAVAVHHGGQAVPAATTGTGTNSTGGGNDLGPSANDTTNTYSGSDVFSNYIGGSVGLQSFVDGLYIDVLHRRATSDELTFWTGTLESGRFAPYTVVSYFLQSPEAVQAGGSGTQLLPSHPPANVYTGYLGGDVGVKAFVDGLYYDVFQRDPDPAGEAYWVGQIENHDLLPAKITFSFLASTEFVPSTTQ